MDGRTPQNVLLLAPHPDDETLGCGGTIKMITSSGGTVDVLYMTRGERGVAEGVQPSPAEMEELARRRTLEARAACKLLGVRNVDFLLGQDCGLRSQPQLAAEILLAIQSREYRSIFCPWPGDGHVDHKATFALMHRAIQQIDRNLEIWLYEVWTPLEANMTLSIDSTMAFKLQAIDAYQSQLALYDYKTAFHSLAKYRSILCPTVRHAEAFFNCDRETLLRDQDLPWSPGRPLALVSE